MGYFMPTAPAIYAMMLVELVNGITHKATRVRPKHFLFLQCRSNSFSRAENQTFSLVTYVYNSLKLDAPHACELNCYLRKPRSPAWSVWQHTTKGEKCFITMTRYGRILWHTDAPSVLTAGPVQKAGLDSRNLLLIGTQPVDDDVQLCRVAGCGLRKLL